MLCSWNHIIKKIRSILSGRNDKPGSSYESRDGTVTGDTCKSVTTPRGAELCCGDLRRPGALPNTSNENSSHGNSGSGEEAVDAN